MFSSKKKEINVDVLIKLTGEILSQYRGISNHHIHFKFLTISSVSYTSMKLKKKKKKPTLGDWKEKERNNCSPHMDPLSYPAESSLLFLTGVYTK